MRQSFFLLGVTFVLYFPSLTATFVYDDHFLIEENPFLSSSRGIFMAFTQDYYAQSNPNSSLGYYRPISILSHWIDWQLWKDHAFGHHLTSVLIHLAVVWLLYEVLLLIFKDPHFAFLASLIFAIHPSHVSTVSFISARVDAVSTLFVLLSLYAFKKRKFLSPVFYFLALLSKEISVTAPALIWWKQREKNLKSAFLWMVPFVAVLMAVVFLRLKLLGSLSKGVLNLDPDSGLLLLDYIRLLLLPPVKLYLEPSVKNLPLLLDVFCSVLYLSALLFLPDKRKAGWCAIWLITLLPVLGLIRIETVIDERFLYLPSISFCMVAAAWILTYLEWRSTEKTATPRAVWITACVLILAYSPLLLTRQAYWNNELSLWGSAADADPESAKAHNNYAMALIHANQLMSAETELHRSLQLQDSPLLKASIYVNLALIRHLQNRDQEVEALYKKAIGMRPRYFIAHYNLGLFYEQQGRFKEAISELQAAVDSNPYSVKAHLYLSHVLTRVGRHEEALRHAKLARQLGQ